MAHKPVAKPGVAVDTGLTRVYRARMHALVIEDQFLIATLIEDELRDLGYTSIEIVDRKEAAVEAAARRCPDLITADDRITVGSGLRAVQVICAHEVIPVVFIVGDPGTIEAPIPFAAIIAKPFGGVTLKEAVEEARAKAERHLAAST